MKKIIIFLSVLLNIICLPASTKTKRGLDGAKSNDIIILHTNDVHCGVNDTIGYDGLMLYKKQLQQKYNTVLLVDAGDHIQGGTIGMITNGTAIIEIMNKLGYDVATLGNHEFDYEIPQLEKIEKLLNCSYISCNYCFRENKTSIYSPFKIKEAGGKKIGFIGIATPETILKTYLITILDSSGKPVYDFLTDNKSQDLYDRVQKHIDELKAQGVDYIIILAHLGKGESSLEEHTSLGLLKNLKNVNALIDGHTHLVYSETTNDKDGKPVILAQTGTKLANIGVLTIYENGTFSHENINEVPYDPTLADQTLNLTRSDHIRYVDKEMNEYINGIFDSFSAKLQRVIGHSDFDLNVYKNSSETTSSKTQLSRVQENTLCNLVTDAMKRYGEADITILNAGAVRKDVKQGDITYQNVIDTMPYSNDVIVKQITGQTILDALEFATRFLPESSSRFPQVSGITYKIDTSINSSVVVDSNGVFQSVSGERRVYGVKVNGEDVDVKKNYTISTSSYILGGGDGFSMFTDFEITRTSAGVDNQVLLKYIENDLNGVIPEKYSEVEGRIVKTNGKVKNSASNNIRLSLLGFNGLNKTNNAIKFYTYLTSLETISFSFPKKFFLPLILQTKSNLRSLSENANATCTLDSEIATESGTNKTKYLCEHKNTSSNINNINNIQIGSPNVDNFKIEESPIAQKCMNNLDSDCYINENTTLYILKNSSIIEQNQNSFVVSGTINTDKNESISFSNKELTLLSNHISDNGNTEFPCTITNINGNNYNITCKVEKKIACNLENSMINDGDKLLLVNFEEGTNSNVTFGSNSNTKGKKYFIKSSGKSKAGLIAVLITVPIVALAIFAALYFVMRNNITKPVMITSNTSNTLANINGLK